MNIPYMALTQSLAHHAQEMRRFGEADKQYTTLAEWANSCNDWDSVAMALHQLGRTAEEHRDFSRAADFYLKALKIFTERSKESAL